MNKEEKQKIYDCMTVMAEYLVSMGRSSLEKKTRDDIFDFMIDSMCLEKNERKFYEEIRKIFNKSRYKTQYEKVLFLAEKLYLDRNLLKMSFGEEMLYWLREYGMTWERGGNLKPPRITNRRLKEFRCEIEETFDFYKKRGYLPRDAWKYYGRECKCK